MLQTPRMAGAGDDWLNVGPHMGGVAAEALCAYEVWRTASEEMDVLWVSGHGHDVGIRTPGGGTVRIDAKRAWGRGLPKMEVLTPPIWKTSTCLTLPSPALT